ncbi:MAG: hypothetical protein FWH20_07325 [Oscillospiraceae bacterium]|nr:hypothetical protein [Oscillospiraceae bacterium]
MIKQINNCKHEFDKLLAENSPDTDWEKEAEKLLERIKFFQHERIVHLIVTMTMSLLTVIFVCVLNFVGETVLIPFVLLFALCLALTAAYLVHYYRLENGVQELYGYYEKFVGKFT